MQKFIKITLAIFLTFFSSLYFLANIGLLNFAPESRLNLGLDLQGGSHLLLDVDFDGYLSDSYQSIADRLRKEAKLKRVGYKKLYSSNSNIEFNIRNENDHKLIKQIVRDLDGNLSIKRDDKTITLFYEADVISKLQDNIINQSIEIIRMRIDENGTKEPTIQRQGKDRILLQVPGVQNPSELKRVLGKTAKLTFHLVETQTNKKSIRKSNAKLVKFNEQSNLLIKRNPVISGNELTNAQVQFQDSVPVVSFSLNNLGSRKFARATKNNPGKRLAIVLDDVAISAPIINEPILGGSGRISGNFTIESAAELALMLRAGALPAKLKIIEERTVGPSLGADSIDSGKIAAIIAFILVCIFMILTYGIFGIFATFTLIFTVSYIVAMLSILQATLTLPGIAGIILTIGMAVDANVLIYERITEEIKGGASNLYATQTGFKSAFGTIMDSNLTTLIAASALYIFGTGTVKGFAVTLTIGIIASMYSAVIVTKLMIDGFLRYTNPKQILGIKSS